MIKLEYIGKCLLIEEMGKRIIVIGDLHLGYEQALNEGGVFVSRKMYNEMISELERVFEIAEKGGEINEVVLVGDVKQEFEGILKQERGDTIRLVNWLVERSERVTITKGNHDAILEPILRGKEGIELRDHYCLGEVIFAHGDKNIDEFWSKEVELIVIGHWHPAIELIEGIKKERYKCFLEGTIRGKKIVVLPSFVDNREGIDIRNTNFKEKFGVSGEMFEVIVVNNEGDLKGFEFGKLKKIRS